MEGEFDGFEPRRRWPWVVLLAALAFLAGAGATGWLAARNPRAAALLGLEPVAQAGQQVAVLRRQLAQRPPTPAAPPAGTGAQPDPALATQVAALSEKVDDIETQARAATGDASRAEGLLVAFAARRALDRGMQLGYIEGLLRERFGHAQPDAVAAVLSAARTPVTLADLQTGLDQVAPRLSIGEETARESWWQAVRRELAGMVVVRRADQPSALPADRVERAQRLLEGGQVDGALAEVMRLADHAPANGWIAAARRYLAGRSALDRIETAALLDPPAPAPAASDGATSAVAAAPTGPAPVD